MLRCAQEALKGMDGLRALFQEYDKDGTGSIDMHEFQRITDDLGFGGAAHEIFLDLDDDNSGFIQYSEVIDRLVPSAADPLKSTTTTKKFLMVRCGPVSISCVVSTVAGGGHAIGGPQYLPPSSPYLYIAWVVRLSSLTP